MNTMSDENRKLIIDIGIMIAEFRNKKKISQETLAEKSGIHRTYLSEVEGGKRNPTILVLNKIIVALEVSMSEFFERVEEKGKNGQ